VKRIGLLNGLHFGIQLVIIPDNPNTSIDASLNLDCTKAEHCQSCSVGSIEVLWTGERLSHVLDNIDTLLSQEGNDGSDVKLDTE